MVKLHIKSNTYYDSVALMLISKELKKLAGVNEALVGMGTDLNKEIAVRVGLDSPDLQKLSANDFFIAVDYSDSDPDNYWQKVLDKVEELLNSKKQSGSKGAYKPLTLSSAIEMIPGINLALISVPGIYAAEVAMDCLMRDIHVMMFSDNVSLEDELRLKEFAVEKGLLMMGPDCGTAIINNVPLAFANIIRPGNIGIVGASGTGTQEVSSIIDQLGGGVSQVIGTGGRDLKEEIGGLMFSLALDALIADKNTEVIVLISKPPSKTVQEKIIKQAENGGKPTVICFIGPDGLTLEDAAIKAVSLSKKQQIESLEGFNKHLEVPQTQGKYIRGLYTGGTLCDEAMYIIGGDHTFIDFGDDTYTVGRPHPMIDPSLRNEQIIKEASDPETAVILLDCVIGYGAHENAAGELAQTISQIKNKIVVASVCGTENDPQCLSASRKTLEDAGAFVFPSNAQAARFAKLVVRG